MKYFHILEWHTIHSPTHNWGWNWGLCGIWFTCNTIPNPKCLRSIDVVAWLPLDGIPTPPLNQQKTWIPIPFELHVSMYNVLTKIWVHVELTNLLSFCLFTSQKAHQSKTENGKEVHFGLSTQAFRRKWWSMATWPQKHAVVEGISVKDPGDKRHHQLYNKHLKLLQPPLSPPSPLPLFPKS